MSEEIKQIMMRQF